MDNFETININNKLSDNIIDVNNNCDILAVDVKDIVFEYKRDVKVLNNLSLQIPKGKISALLGPNGTGKTTLIQTILGLHRPTSGSIHVFGVKPGLKESDIPGPGVGYMPQELALFEEFTINEILNYYGMIYHMNREEVMNRIENLRELLHLPEKSRLISQLSGGQKRRVSIAITMLHKPRLVILDEPTVGVDSLLRHKIWQYLEHMCKTDGQTVLITTHYIEEARSAGNVAFMSAGTILKQSEPNELMAEYECPTLEDVYYKLCINRRNSQHKLHELKPENTSNKEIKPKPVIKPQAKPFIDFQRVLALLWKYYTLTMRRPFFLYVYFLLPLIVLTCVRYAIGHTPRHVPIVVHNGEMDAPNSELSRQYIEAIDKEYVQIHEVRDFDDAYKSVVNGTNSLMISLSHNFTAQFETRMLDYLTLDEVELDESKIKLYVDFTNPAITVYVLKFIKYALNTMLEQNTYRFGENSVRFMHTLDIKEPVYGTYDFSLANQFGPGVLLGICHILPMIIAGLQIINDRKNNCLERIKCAGIKPIEIYLAHLLQNILLIAIQMLFTMFIAFVIYENEQKGSYFEVYLVLFFTGIQGMGFGLLTGLLLDSEPTFLVSICIKLNQYG
ncbi:unnamed protein product [Medioppia subpectinata]|uniref:ABC transporter domain-containing protein n=1 Tax=Medioppia subpectinata TaxID=1979941 RepID=A0A7R9Q3F5_9ACAR|nr:unnamed protein product [Medioppia subpectinata]CAG2111247.1 unnamed protein product [Medioppia subpectinata]